VTNFDALHPAVQHHIVNTLGWSSLRPLQDLAIPIVSQGQSALLIAPTAAGKTEAAFFPLLSRTVTERWSGLSSLYVCPLRALLNNLEPRLTQYASLVGRRVAIWHGDVGDADRRRVLEDPPDILLTTPESIEVMLITPRVDHQVFFANIRAVVIDELHAFAGDDRGWHLLAVLERVQRIAGRRLQKIGLSATVGNPEQMLRWLTAGSAEARVVAAPGVSSIHSDVTVDYVGNLENAATVIAKLHPGEKRLVFSDSRTRTEELSSLLRRSGVQTFVSHSSLSTGERRMAEEAFTSGRDCVIVATSTLELGIDVGDLDRVIQIDAPYAVASFLQRLGRTGRRAGTQRNCLFLSTAPDTLVRAAGLTQLWADGYIESITPPPNPLHLLAQQILALALQERGIGARDWPGWIHQMLDMAMLAPTDVQMTLQHMVERGLLFEDAGILSMGVEGEREFGRRHFMELMSAFLTDPLFVVRHGRAELGHVHQASFAMKDDRAPVLLLAGRSWVVTHIDWASRTAFVEPTTLEGRSRWLGAGQGIQHALCHAIHKVLSGTAGDAHLSNRAAEKLAEIRADFSWLEDGSTTLVRHANGRLIWWTFGSLFANAALAAALRDAGVRTGKVDNFAIALDASEMMKRTIAAVDTIRSQSIDAFASPVADRALEELKFSVCLPDGLARKVVQDRTTDRKAIDSTLRLPTRVVTLSDARAFESGH
jgi:ATP-dependent Lhr-like helicase